MPRLIKTQLQHLSNVSSVNFLLLTHSSQSSPLLDAPQTHYLFPIQDLGFYNSFDPEHYCFLVLTLDTFLHLYLARCHPFVNTLLNCMSSITFSLTYVL